MSLLLPMFLASFAANAACDQSTTRVELAEKVQLARAAFAAEDRPVLEAAAQDTRWTLGCIAEPVGAHDVALVHLVIGLELWDPDDPDPAVPWLARYAATFPAAEDARDDLPAGLTDEERQVFEVADAAIDFFVVHRGPRLPPPFPGKVLVDGNPDLRHAPKNAPYVFQRLAGRRVLQTDLVAPNQKRLPYPRFRPLSLTSGLALTGASVGLFLGAKQVDHRLHTWEPADGIGRHEDEAAYFKARANLNHGLYVGGVATATLAAFSLGGFAMSYAF